MKLKLLLLCTAIALSGCQVPWTAGSGQSGDNKTMATVKGVVSVFGMPFGYHGVQQFDISAVDSKDYRFFTPSKVMLTPGTHTIEVKTAGVMGIFQGMTCFLTFDAKAGKVYLLRPFLADGAIGAAVIDQKTKKVITSDPPEQWGASANHMPEATPGRHSAATPRSSSGAPRR